MARGATRRASLRSNDTKVAILDAAEELFSDRGFDGVSVRDIAALADVGLASITYYFATKDSLLEEVVDRRAETLNQLRLDALEKALVDGGEVPLILEAYVAPYYDLMKNGGKGWKNYSMLIAQMAQGNRWLPLIEKHFNSTAKTFLAALYNTIPGVREDRIVKAFVYYIQLMVSELADNQREATLTQKDKEPSRNGGYETLVRFATGGFESLTRD